MICGVFQSCAARSSSGASVSWKSSTRRSPCSGANPRSSRRARRASPRSGARAPSASRTWSVSLRPYPHWKQHASRDAQRNKMEPGPNCAHHMLFSVCSVCRTVVMDIQASRVASRVALHPVWMGPSYPFTPAMNWNSTRIT